MWLINTHTLTLKFFMSSEGLRFAILSHTWGDEEVNFREMGARGESGLQKAGWAKIVKTCDIARDTFGLDYAWVDTCCIDKSSSSELSEAINSMFSWYKTAAVCVVFLEDLELPADKDCKPGSIGFRNRLGACRWFGRGWTLQELIAPSEMVFYDRDWVHFGTKAELVSDLSEVTGIEKSILRNVDLLFTAHVGKRMSWAASRQTTRVEDLAYCLLGIFDVNMPLLYGEGEKAFLRLQEEIARSRNDLTLFAWLQDRGPVHGPAFRGIFAASPAEFRHCHKLRVPEEPLQQDVEFSLTNRGLRIDSNIYDSDFGYPNSLMLALDCLEYSDFLPAMGIWMWIHIHLTKVGSRYVRAQPQNFHHVHSRQQQQLRVATKDSAIYIAPTIPSFVARTMSSHLDVDLVYSKALRDRVGQRDVSHERVLRSADFERSRVGVITSPEWIQRRDFVLKDVPRMWHADLDRDLYWVTRFTSQGLQNDQFCHVFPCRFGWRGPAARIALVCGLSCLNPGGSGPESARFPWAALVNEDDPSISLLHPVDLSATAISHEQKTRLLHRYIFARYSDEGGSLRLGDLPTKISISDDKLTRFCTITAKVVLGLQSKNGLTIMLSCNS